MQEMQDTIPGSGRSLGVGNGNPLQYSCLENSTENEAWQTPVHRVRRVRHGWEVDHEHVPSTLTFWRIFVINECWTLQKLILHQLRCFFFILQCVNMVCHTYWFVHLIMVIFLWIWFASTLRGFASIFIMRLAWFPFFCYLYLILASGWWWPHSMNLGMLLLQFSRRVSEW